MGKTLQQLFRDHKGKVSDKWSLYLDEWDRLFKPYRNQRINILEIGIQNGGSLEVWGKYFPAADKIVGCDIDEKCGHLRYDDARIAVVVDDANSDECESKILQLAPSFDVIIDDGSHRSSDIVRSFARYFPHLNDSGIYVVEDLHTSYWENFEGGLYNPLSAMAFFKRLSDLINYEHWRNNKPRGSLLAEFSEKFGLSFSEFDLARIHSIEILNSLIIIKKLPPQRNVLGKRVVVGMEQDVTSEWNKLNSTVIQDIAVDIKDDARFDVFELIAESNSLTRMVSDGEQAFLKLTKQMAEKEQSVQELTSQAAEKEQIVLALKGQMAEKELAVQQLMTQVVEKEQSMLGLKEQVAALSTQVVTITTQAMLLSKQMVDKGQEVQALQSQVDKKERAVQKLSEMVTGKDQVINELTAKVAEQNLRLQTLSAHVAEQDSLVTSLTSKLAVWDSLAQSLTKRVSEQDLENQSLNKILSDNQAEIKRITMSTSWRITRPLRRIMRVSQNLKSYIVIWRSGLFDRKYYLNDYPDVRNAHTDPLMHFIEYGWREGRNPSKNFDTNYYLNLYKDVKDAQVNPLEHFILFGAREGRSAIPGGNKSFNDKETSNLLSSSNDVANATPKIASSSNGSNNLPSSETQTNNDIESIRFRPNSLSLRKRIAIFWKYFLRTPNFVRKGNYVIRNYGFKEFFVRVKNKVEYEKKINSLIDPIKKTYDQDSFRDIYEQLIQVSSNKPSTSYVDFVRNNESDFDKKIKLIAFYLPQFHPIPENDLAWGKGFTEWTNVSKAVPQFRGHYQPHLPGELGFYDLRNPDVQERQVELAKNYGIYGFCFYYYWFNGKKLLDKPLDLYIANPNIDFPFCLCWANENWTKKWDGKNDEIIIGQKHSIDEDTKFIEDIIPLFKDKRYIRINQRPVLIVYNVKLLERPSELIQNWRKIAIRREVGDPFIIAAQTFEFDDPRPYGFDAAVMFPPHNVVNVPNLRDQMDLVNKDYDGAIFNYPDMSKEIIKRFRKEPFVHFMSVFPGWDNEPRRPGKGFSFINSTPKDYENWLRETCLFTRENNSIDEQFVFINAWNEWAEGAHLEPDRKFGYGYLQATKDALCGFEPREPGTIINGSVESDNQITKGDPESIKKYERLYLETKKRDEEELKDKELSELYSGDPNPDPVVSLIIPVHNHFDQTFNCLRSISKANEKTSFEVIIIDDCSNDETARVISGCRGLRYLRNEKNIGFLNSCNLAANYAKGIYIVLLNNDTVVLPGWLDSLVGTFMNYPDAGLVGSKLIFPNGTLQEAGSVIWADGSAMNYGRGDDPEKPEYNYLREVDYCSGASIIIPSSLWKKLNGFDRLYEPAYYEDDDLAFRVREAGFKVLYQPLSRVFHVEGATSGTDLTLGIKQFQEINRGKFFKRWKKSLISYGNISQPDFIYRNHSRNKRALVIDVCTPKPDQDSGSIDTYNYLLSLRKIGFEVTFISAVDSHKLDRYVQTLQGIGICCQYPPYLISIEEYIRNFGNSFDLVFLFRAPFGGKFIDAVKTNAPKTRIVFNTVDLHFLREEREKNISKVDSVQLEGVSRDDELSIMRKADQTILVSEHEKELLNEIDPNIKTTVISLPREIPGRTNGFTGRKDILFIGGFLHRPNVDAVIYFLDKVWPLIRRRIPDCKFYIIGSNVPEEIKVRENKRIIVVGYVQELSEYFSKIKLSVSPLRFGAGVKGKILTSLSFGVPCVASPIAAEGMGLQDNLDILIGKTEEEFADAVFKLYRSEEVWELLSQNGLSFIRKRHSLEQFENKLGKLIEGLDSF